MEQTMSLYADVLQVLPPSKFNTDRRHLGPLHFYTMDLYFLLIVLKRKNEPDLRLTNVKCNLSNAVTTLTEFVSQSTGTVGTIVTLKTLTFILLASMSSKNSNSIFE